MHDLMLVGVIPPSGVLEVRSPWDDRLLESVATSGPEHADAALATAYAAFRNREAWLSAPQRIEILGRTAELMRQQADELALLAASEGGKPLSDSVVEVTRAIDSVHLCI